MLPFSFIHQTNLTIHPLRDFLKSFTRSVFSDYNPSYFHSHFLVLFLTTFQLNTSTRPVSQPATFLLFYLFLSCPITNFNTSISPGYPGYLGLYELFFLVHHLYSFFTCFFMCSLCDIKVLNCKTRTGCKMVSL